MENNVNELLETLNDISFISESVIESIDQPISESLTVEPDTEPIVEIVIETNTESTVESIKENSVEPITDSIVENVVQPIIESIVETIEEPKTEFTGESIVESIIETIVETVEEPIIESVIEPITEPKVELIAEKPISNDIKNIELVIEPIDQNTIDIKILMEKMNILEKNYSEINFLKAKIEQLEEEIKNLKIIKLSMGEEEIQDVSQTCQGVFGEKLENDWIEEENNEIIENNHIYDINNYEVAENNLLNNQSPIKSEILNTNSEIKDFLICFIGDLTNSENTWNNFNKNVLSRMKSYDICTCIGAKTSDEFKNSQYFQNAKYKWVYHEPDNWMNVYQYIGNRESNKGKISYELIKELDKNFNNNFRQLFYYYYLKQQLDESGIGNNYKYIYVTKSNYYHELEFVPIELLSDDFYLFESKNNNQISIDNFITKFSKLDIISNYLVNILLGLGNLSAETNIIKMGNILKLNYWYLIKMINKENIGYISPTMYRIYNLPLNKSFIKNSDNLYFEQTINTFFIKKLQSTPDIWHNYKKLITNSLKPIQKSESTYSSSSLVFKNNVKGARATRPVRVPKRR